MALVPAPPRDPVWSGQELVLIVVLTVGAIVVATLALVLVWGLARSVFARPAVALSQSVVALTLLGQTAGFALGVAIAWLWIAQLHHARFWPAIHWRPLRPGLAAAVLAGGAATMVGVQVLGHFLPIPPDLPMDRLFTPHTAWMLMLYGVLAAPFFEEFFFRGLLYPSLRATFADGISPEELRRWSLILRAAAFLGVLALALWRWRERLLGLPLGPGALALWSVALLLCLLALAAPGLPLAAGGWGINLLARWRRPELLAILVTGLCFGLLHAA
ncbi:MAG: CPBP family glutamic-type intramembrane protease, partial [Terriglobales bacterium]